MDRITVHTTIHDSLFSLIILRFFPESLLQDISTMGVVNTKSTEYDPRLGPGY